jgi:enoyl-CoA hydratase/carnithine racemase
MPFTRIRQEVAGPVAIVTLAGPDAGNLIDEVMAAELREALSELDDDPSVRAVVLTGNGPDFSCGTVLEDRPSGDLIASHAVASSIARVGKATVAALEGDALGQGLELALACDLRIAGATVRFCLTRPDSPGIPWDGGTQRLPRLIGRSRALEMALLARVLGAEEAAAIGLVAEVAEPGQALQRAIKAGEVIATHGPVAVRYLKEAVYKGADLALDQAMRLEVDLATLLHSTTDRAEGLSAFAEKRKPEFLGE